MTAVAAERAKDGYLLGKDEGEAHWLLGMLEVVKISGADTGGAFGLLEVTVRSGEGSPWHGAAAPDRRSQWDGNPRPSRPASDPLAARQSHQERPLARRGGRATTQGET